MRSEVFKNKHKIKKLMVNGFSPLLGGCVKIRFK
jgi:hypothetical protein